jgi:hypothetical protein
MKSVRWGSVATTVTLMAAMSLSSPAKGGEAPPDSAKAGKEAYSRGSAFFNLGQYAKAMEAWQHGYELTNEPSFLYNLGQAARLSNDPERAIFFYNGLSSK